MNQKIAIFQQKEIRKTIYNDEWWFSVIDICGVLTDAPDNLTARKYWNKLAQRLRDEGSEAVTFCHRLKLKATDGKMRETDCANTQGIFRLIQSIPSPKAEPFKLWLAKVGHERIQEIENPELAQERMKELYEKKGYSKSWIDKRLRGIAVRQDLTEEWKNRGAKKGVEYAILTNEIIQGAFGMNVDDYKNFKSLKRENLRDHMTDLELILTMLGEATTTKLTKNRDSVGFEKLQKDAQDGGQVAGRTREDIELQSGQPVTSQENFLEMPESQKKLTDF